jgi:hypothetical protein
VKVVVHEESWLSIAVAVVVAVVVPVVVVAIDTAAVVGLPLKAGA